MSHKIHVGVQHNGTVYDIFVLGFDSSGGYFLTDVIGIPGQYLINKIPIRLKGFGTQMVPWDSKKTWVTSHKPKMIHHFDGNVHVSGPGIKSGFYKVSRSPKGVATKSTYFNDGGPVFGFLCWGVEHYSVSRSRDAVVFDSSLLYRDVYRADAERHNLSYVFEGFYIPKSSWHLVDPKTKILQFKHPNYGIIPMVCIDTPAQHEGFIAISCRISTCGFQSKYGFDYGCGASLPDTQGYIQQIHIMFPYPEIFGQKSDELQTLDLRSQDMALYRLDDKLSSYIGKVKKFFKKALGI